MVDAFCSGCEMFGQCVGLDRSSVESCDQFYTHFRMFTLEFTGKILSKLCSLVQVFIVHVNNAELGTQ